MQKRWLTRSVLIISIVSLLNDASSELLYPVLPIYLAGIGFGAMWIGLIEGIAEAAAGLSKGWFGKWSDMRGERLPFIRLGYLLSAIAKPLIVVFPNIFWALFMRSSDRLGKGIRTGARDAMLAHQSTPENRGKVYGFHRAMDTTGAIIGPALALWWLITHRGENIAYVFYLAFIPGCLSIVALLFLRDHPSTGSKIKMIPKLKNAFSYWKDAPTLYRKVVSGFLLFALFNSSDLFLLLAIRIIHEGTTTCILGWNFTANEIVILYYILYNLVYALLAFPAGYLSDKLNPKTMFMWGIFCYTITYAGFGILLYEGSSPGLIPLILMAVYGLYGALNDGISKAWLSVLIPKEERGAALGFYAGANSIALLFASLTAGLIWSLGSPWIVFTISACLTFVVIFYLATFTQKPAKENQH